MKRQIQQPAAVSHTIQSKPKAAKQADMHTVLQKYAVAQRVEMSEEDELLQGRFETAQRKEQSIVHEKGCNCSCCVSQFMVSKSNPIQLTCDEGHPNHPKGPCRMSDPSKWDEKRAGQSHPQHSGDKKGRERMYEKRKKKDSK